MKTLKHSGFIQNFQWMWVGKHSADSLCVLTELPLQTQRGKKTEHAVWSLRWVVNSENSCVWVVVLVTLTVNRLRLSKQLHYVFTEERALSEMGCMLIKYSSVRGSSPRYEKISLVVPVAVKRMPSIQSPFPQALCAWPSKFTSVHSFLRITLNTDSLLKQGQKLMIFSRIVYLLNSPYCLI